MSNEVRLVFAGDATKLEKTLDSVGSSSSRMVKKIDDQSAAHTRLGERIGSTEGKFRGLADLSDGLGGALGIPTAGATNMFRAFSDLSGGFEIVSGMLPGLSGLFPRLAGAMTFVSAHPLMIGLLAGGAIIAGLVLLEKKFGLVSGAVSALGDAFSWAWHNAIKPALNLMLSGIELWLNTVSTPVRLLSKVIPGIPDLPKVNLPRLDVGGTILQSGLAVVHRGEVVQPAGGRLAGAGGSGMNVTVNVHGSVTTQRDLVDAIHSGLLDKQRRSGNLGIRAA